MLVLVRNTYFLRDALIHCHTRPLCLVGITPPKLTQSLGDVRVPSGRCLRVTGGDIFFNVGVDGLQTAWWSEGSVITDLYFKNGKIPWHDVVPELSSITEHGSSKKLEL